MHIVTARYSILLGLAAMLAMSQHGVASKPINGQFCGKALSGGEVVDVTTTLTTQADGLLAGEYQFEDKGQITPGTLREYVKQSDDTRTLIWIDKYGTGQLVARFDDNRASFEGLWGVRITEPSFQWDGQRCNFDSVMNSNGSVAPS